MKRAARFLIAVASVLALAARGAAQTKDQPLRSRMQVVGAPNGGTASFLVDPGATRLTVDVRQNGATDTSAITAPSGAPVGTKEFAEIVEPSDDSVDTTKGDAESTKSRDEDATVAVDRPVVHADLSSSGDPVGKFQDVTTWTTPVAGQYGIASAQPYLAMVQIDGGAELTFWMDGIGTDGLVGKQRPLTFWAILRDGGGHPLAGADISATLKLVAKPDGTPTDKPWSTRLTLEPAVGATTYAASFAAGVPKSGVYNLVVTGVQGLSRRDVVTSLGSWDGGSLPAPGAPPPPITAKVVSTIEKVSAFPGQIFYGDQSRADPFKPVIVFLHGWNSDTAIWDRPNGGFYHAALDANYRVASIGLFGNRDFMTNAEILAEALPAVAAYYDVRQMVVVAHSKGGVDFDAAAMFANATDYVRTVMTLSTPHVGTPLADLTDLPGITNDEATRSMRVGVMLLFRAQTLNNPHNQLLDFRTFGGWGYDAGRFDSTLGFAYATITGPLLFGLAGPNDGIVPYLSSLRPSAREMFSGPFDRRTDVNHEQIRKRVDFWSNIQAQLLQSSWDNTPSSPQNLAAQLATGTSDTGDVTLTWESRNPRLTAVRVERSIDGGAFEDLAGLLPVTLAYVDAGVGAGHTYAYRVRHGFGDQLMSSYSNVASVTFPSPVPSPPTQLVAAATSPMSVRLTWVDASGNETAFEVYRRPGAGAPWRIVALVPSGVTLYDDDRLQGLTSYQYRVRAVNGTYASDYSNVASVMTPNFPLTAPSSLTGTYNVASNRVTLRWVDNSVNETGFHLQMAYVGGAWTDLNPATVGADVTTYLTGTFPIFGNFEFRVQATRGAELSPWSNVAAVTVAP